MTSPLGKWWSTNCTVHGTHWPRSHSTVFHHIWPLGMGGPDTKENQVEVCPTGHTNIHMLIDLLQDNQGAVDKSRTKGFSRREIELARRGYTEWADDLQARQAQDT